MKTTTLASIFVVTLLLAGVAAVALAGTATTTTSSTSTQKHDNDDRGRTPACKGLTAGETLTIKGLTGHYKNLTDLKSTNTASGRLSLQVSNIYFAGCTISITGGSLKLGSTTVSITGGNVILNRGGHSGDGWGTTTGGSFLLQLSGLRGNSTSATLGAAFLDWKSGSSEFLIHLNQ